ncbi:MAG: PAS domain-containing protein [Methanobacterium sp.]|uniref:sensor histidine kinase n=1 Tax=Methanobacterium sp. TaxID=2164 RepID=UPI003D65BDC8|nr:PAS domain-containing protein [Methanobacterium sp.]
MRENKYGGKFEDLRMKAEESLTEKKGPSTNLVLEIDELIHELEVHQIELEMQNEDLIKTQIELEASRKDYYELYDFAPVGYLILDKKGIIKRINLAGAKILGKPRKYLIDEAFIRFIAPSYQKTFHDHIQEIKKTHLKKQCQIELITANEIPLFVSLDTVVVFNEKGDYKEFRIILTDISENKKMEREMENSLKEKELLLKEIHHRVKNNMQIISSLLNLQKNYVEGEESLNILQESQNRVKSMAMIHEKLYKSKKLTHINIKDYIQSLVSDLSYFYGAIENNINAITEIDDIKLNLETAIPFGLIINELVSNSLKYAFTNKKQGEIKVSFKTHGQKYELIISDDGIGIPKDIDFKNTDSLGLQLVNNLIDQLDGEIEIEKTHGTKFKIKFKELKYETRI